MTSAKQRRLRAMEAGGYDLSGRHQSWDIPAHFVRYDPCTGRILETGTMASAAIDRMRQNPDRRYLKGIGSRFDHFVDVSGDVPVLRKRTACQAALEGATLTGLPVPCVVTVVDEAGEETVIECDESALNLSFDYSGTYMATVSSVPHADGVFTIEV